MSINLIPYHHHHHHHHHHIISRLADLILDVDAVVHDGQEPGRALERVGAAGLEVERAQPPVLLDRI